MTDLPTRSESRPQLHALIGRPADATDYFGLKTAQLRDADSSSRRQEKIFSQSLAQRRIASGMRQTFFFLKNNCFIKIIFFCRFYFFKRTTTFTPVNIFAYHSLLQLTKICGRSFVISWPTPNYSGLVLHEMQRVLKCFFRRRSFS